MKWLLSLLLLAACASVPPQQTARKSVMVVQTDTGHGSGVVINDKCALTAAHVVNGAKELVLIGNDTKPHVAAIAAVDTEKDIGVVCAAKSLNAPPVQMVDKMPPDWTPVFTIGFPLDKEWILTEGLYQEDATTTTPVAPGNSGGGVFTKDGKYVGFIDALSLYQSPLGVLDFPHLASIVPVTDIRTFLDANHITYRG